MKRIYIFLKISLCWEVLSFYFLIIDAISSKLLLPVVVPSVEQNIEIHPLSFHLSFSISCFSSF